MTLFWVKIGGIPATSPAYMSIHGSIPGMAGRAKMTQNRSYFDPLLAGGPIFKGATLGVLGKTPPKEGPKIGSNMAPGPLPTAANR
jgi:hypothetical protein